MKEHSWTPEQISSGFTILQLMALFSRDADQAAICGSVQDANDEAFKKLLRAKGRLKSQ